MSEISTTSNLSKPVLHSEYSRMKVRWAISVFYFMQGLCFASWASQIPHFKSELGLSDAALGTILFALPAGQIITMFFSGQLTTKFGSKRMLSLSAPFYALSLVLLSFAHSGWYLALFLMLFGITGNLCNIALNTQGVAGENYYGKPIMSSFHGVWSVGNASGALLALALVNLHIGITWHFAIAAAISCCNIFFNSKILLEFKQQINASKEKGIGKSIPTLLILLGIIAFFSMGTEGTMFDWSAVYFKDIVKIKPNLAILGYLCFMCMMAIGRFMGVPLINRFGRKKILQTSGIIISAGMSLAVIFPNPYIAGLGFMLVGMGVSSIVPMLYSIAGNNDKIPAGKAITMVSSIGYFAFLAGPPMIGFISEAFNLRISFAVIAFLGLFITVISTKVKAIN